MLSLFTAMICLGGLTTSHNSYHMGNSLTLDARTHLLPHDNGYTIRPAASLNKIFTEPEWPFNKYLDPSGNIHSVHDADYGNINHATANFAWDYISLQPYPGSQPNTLSTDLTAFQQVQALEPNATMILYQGYPSLLNSSDVLTPYADQWAQPLFGDPLDPKAGNTQLYLAALEAKLTEVGINHRVARIGEVLKEVDVQAQANNLGSFSGVDEFYDEDPKKRHLTPEGDYIAYATMYHTIYGTLPASIPTELINDPTWNLTSGEILSLHAIISQINAFECNTVPEPSAWMFGLLTLGMVGGMKFKSKFISRQLKQQ